MESVFLDIQGAFDSVSLHIAESQKLKTAGPSWLFIKRNNFLYNLISEKAMNFDNYHLQLKRTSYHGLVQGSCLSPLLYNFYVNDIDACLAPNCSLRHLADDAVLSVANRDADVIQRSLQTTLNILSVWSENLGIKFFAEKTKMVIFSYFGDTVKTEMKDYTNLISIYLWMDKWSKLPTISKTYAFGSTPD